MNILKMNLTTACIASQTATCDVMRWNQSAYGTAGGVGLWSKLTNKNGN